MDSDFWAGIRLVVTGLVDVASKASFSLAFGAGALGGALLWLQSTSVSGPPLLLISMSAFFTAARIGRALDERLEGKRPQLKASNEHALDELDALRRQIWRLEAEDSETDRQKIIRGMADTANELHRALRQKSK